jgi:hypothetical protein
VWARAVSAKAEAAIQRMLANQGNTSYEGHCEKAVENAFGTSRRNRYRLLSAAAWLGLRAVVMPRFR